MHISGIFFSQDMVFMSLSKKKIPDLLFHVVETPDVQFLPCKFGGLIAKKNLKDKKMG